MRPVRSRIRAGFTLVELMVVALLIALAVGIATPALRPIPTRSSRATADALALLGASARAVAARRGEPAALVVDAGAYTIVALDASGAAVDTLARGALAPGGRVVSGDGEPVVITFSPTGAAHGGPLVVEGEGGRHALEVSPWTGIVAVRSR